MEWQLVLAFLGGLLVMSGLNRIQDRRYEKALELIAQTIDKTARQVAFPGGGETNGQVRSHTEGVYADLTVEEPWEES